MSPIARLWDGWRAFWFTPVATTPLEMLRIGLGLALVGVYALPPADFTALYGRDGWITVEAARAHLDSSWTHSLLFHTDTPWQESAFVGAFTLACIALAIGWHTRWVKWLVLIGQISLAHRNPAIQYGLDNICSSLLVVLCLAPVGRALSLDRWRAARRARLGNLAAWLPLGESPRASMCLRLIQIQMAVFFFVAGAAKLQGQSWWHGYALWIALTNYEYGNIPIGWLADRFWIANLLSYGTIVLELGYPFLIWGRRTRPYLLCAAIALHLGIAVMMGLYAFSFVMILGHLAFLRPEWLACWARGWRARIGAMEMIYDGQCTFCVRSMAALLAFDGLRQITVRDYRTNPSPIVPSELVDKSLYLVTRNRRALPGFEAYRYAVLRVPGLWWMVPLFYLPLLSRALGRPVYDWIASHRHVISTCALPHAGSTASCAPATAAASAMAAPAGDRAGRQGTPPRSG